jgi:hypothetical protein
MAEEVEMTPVAAEPPKADPLAKPAAPLSPTLKLNPVAHKPGATVAAKPGATVNALRPGLKLPPKPGATVNALRPGLKLPPKPGATVAAKPGATVNALRPGLKLPPKPGATVNALKPGLKLPPKPVIHKPGSTIAAAPLPKPVTPVAPAAHAPAAPEAPKPAAAPAAEAPKPAAAPAAEAPKPVAPVAPVAPAAAPAAEAPKPVAIDAQGVGKIPTVQAQAIARDDVAAPAAEAPKPIEQLKAVTQKLKGVTQQIPAQAILRKTGIIADAAMSEAQKEAQKHKTARISLSDAMGVAPVKEEHAPMKTIRIKRPIDIPTSPTKKAALPVAPVVKPTPAADAAAEAPAPVAEVPKTEEAPAMTQRKTLRISRPGGAVRPAGKFGLKRPGMTSATTKAATPVAPAEGAAPAPAEGGVADIADIPDMPMSAIPPMPATDAKPASDGPAWLWALSTLVQAAACAAIGALAWFLYQNTTIQYF